jgi:hypothetical protein
MKRIVTILLVTAVILVAGFIIAVMRQPAEYRVSRSATLNAPPDAVFPHVNELRQWDAWSPWAKLDPNARNSFEGPPAGVGAAMSWAGNHEVGEGKMTIIESRANELVRFRLDFIKPMAGTSESEFTFKSVGGQTALTWTMTGTNDLVGRAFSVVMNMDKMVGGQFEKGLANLKAIVEAPPKP